MYDTETERVIRFKSDEGACAKSAAIDPLGKYLVSTATDGQLSIFTIPEEGNSGEVIKRIKATKQKVQSFGDNPFEVAWSPDGS